MELLSKLTPAQTLFILTNGNVPDKELFKYTFLDLVTQRIIKTTTNSSKDQTKKSIVYLTRGIKFGKEHPKKHEIAFLKPFLVDKSIKYLFQTFAKLVVQSNEANIHQNILNTEEVAPLFKRNWFLSIFRKYRLTKEGQRVQTELTSFIKPLETNLESIIKNDKQKALEIISLLGGNILILKNFDFSLLKQFDKELVQLINSRNASIGDFDYYVDWDFYNSFDDYDGYSIFDSFDSGCSSSDSGCSSCSSCSGCGGCGGCS